MDDVLNTAGDVGRPAPHRSAPRNGTKRGLGERSAWKRLLFLALLMVAVGAGELSAQTVIYVNRAKPPPGGDGSSWGNAFKNLVLALDAATQLSGPVEIWVAKSTYFPDQATGDITRSFVLSADLQLLGGFAGTEMAANERDPDLNKTILTGDLGRNDPNQLADNSIHVLRAQNLSAPAVVDGFTIQGGNASVPGVDDLGGGAVLTEGCELVLRRCVFRRNWAGWPFPEFGDMGGAIYVNENGIVNIEDCSFQDNSAYAGGAIAVLSGDGVPELHIVDSSFEGGRCGTGAAAAILFSRGLLSVEGTLFRDNRALDGAAIRATLAQKVIIRDCEFSENGISGRVAGVELDRCDNSGLSPARIEGSRFFDNSSGPAFGGAFSATSTIVYMTDCEFRRNFNFRVSPVTGNLEGAGTVAIYGGSGSRFTNCLLADNFAGNRAGVALFNADSEFVNCTVVNNHSADEAPPAAGIDGGNSQLVLRNLILWGNRHSTGENDALPGVADEVAQFSSGGTVSIRYCDVEGWTGANADGNFAADPFFVAAAAEDYHLLGDSPAVDAGDNSSLPVEILSDLDGQPRIMDGLSNGGMRIDLGSYERTGDIVAVDPGFQRANVSMRIESADGLLRIIFALPRGAEVELSVFDLRGRRIRSLAGGSLPAGEHAVKWNRRDGAGHSVASGVYFVRLSALGAVATGRVVIVH
jgi:hypothetical protein